MNKEYIQGHPLTNYYSVIYRKYDLINRMFTFGLDRKWRKRAAIECLKSFPSDIIDLCCGTGDMAIEICRLTNEKIRISGYDFSESMLKVAREKASKIGYSQINFIQGDVANMPYSDREFDCAAIAFGFRNLTYENPAAHENLKEISRIIKTGGKLVILESAVPTNKLILFFYTIYLRCFLIPLGGLISGDWKAYNYLARSSANFYTPNEIKEILNHHGFKIQFRTTFLLGAASLIAAIKTVQN